jgi:chromosome segregation ATPase
LKKKDLPEMLELDEKLSEIGSTAMELENGSRLNKRKLKKAQSERDVLSERQKKILKDFEKIKEEKNELELALAEQTKTY